MVGLLEAYLAAADERDDFALIEVDTEDDTVEHLGSFATADEALRWAVEDYRAFAVSCEDECGEPPYCLLDRVQFIAGPERVERLLTYRPPEPDDFSELPVMVVADPLTGEIGIVTAEGQLPLDQDGDDE